MGEGKGGEATGTEFYASQPLLSSEATPTPLGGVCAHGVRAMATALSELFDLLDPTMIKCGVTDLAPHVLDRLAFPSPSIYRIDHNSNGTQARDKCVGHE
jgi:hypothetical protein